MSPEYKRGKNLGETLVYFGNHEQLIPTSMVLQGLGVQEIIRVPLCDYPDGARAGTVLTHFGMPIPDVSLGELAVIPKILRSGFYLPGDGVCEERLPLLQFNGVWIARTTLVSPMMAYDRVPQEYFENTIGGCADIEELQELMVARYLRSLPNSTKEEILDEGVSVRKLELIERVSLLH